jgi:hypothetical protein
MTPDVAPPLSISGRYVRSTKRSSTGSPGVRASRTGVELGWGRDPEHPPRQVRILGEFYSGPSPYGHFYRQQIHFFGLGLHLSL